MIAKGRATRVRTSEVRIGLALLFVGLDNPQSRDPRYALYSRPAGCSGARLCAMMMGAGGDDSGFTELQYRVIPKLNLFPVGPAIKSEMDQAGSLLRRQLAGTRARVVCMGQAQFDAITARPTGQMFWIDVDGAYYAWIPHPSGRNRTYNRTSMQRRVGEFLIEAWRRSQK